MTYSAWQYILSFTLYYELTVCKIVYHFVFKCKCYNYFPVFSDFAKFLSILPQKLLTRPKTAGVLPNSSKVDTPLP